MNGEIKGRKIKIDPKAKSTSESEPAFIAKPADAPVYHGFPLIEETRMDGWCFGAITEFEDPNGCEEGDAFIEAPNGERAGLVWDVGEGEIEEICSPDNERWGVYQVWFPKKIRTIQDLKSNFQFILPRMKEIYSKIKNRKA